MDGKMLINLMEVLLNTKVVNMIIHLNQKLLYLFFPVSDIVTLDDNQVFVIELLCIHMRFLCLFSY